MIRRGAEELSVAPRLRGLPTIQGVLALFDASNGVPLAVMDSIEITCLRTAAASAVAAKYLSRADASVFSVIGYGAQALPHVLALHVVRTLERVFVHDTDDQRAHALVRGIKDFGIEASAIVDYRAAVRESDIVVTCTTGRTPLLHCGDLPDGVFLAAVGTDNEDKRELDPLLLADSVVVVDILDPLRIDIQVVQ